MKIRNPKSEIRKIIAISLLLLAFASQSMAVTRFYLPSSGAAGASPGFSASWTDTSYADRVRCSTSKLSTAMADKATAKTVVIGHILLRQYVSDPIAGQTISGTVGGQVRGAEGNTGVNGFSDITIYVVSNDGGTVRGTLLPITSGATEYTTTLTNRNTPVSSSLTPVAAQTGDRIVIEIGANKTANRNNTLTQSFGDDSATDLPVDEVTTAANNPWVEFSQTILFKRRRAILIN